MTLSGVNFHTKPYERQAKSERAAENEAARKELKENVENQETPKVIEKVIETPKMAMRQTPRVPKVLEPTMNQQETPRRSSRAKAQDKEKEKEEEKSESENSAESAEENEDSEKAALTSSLFCGYCKVEYNSDPTIKPGVE